jgi:hypothetical protein
MVIESIPCGGGRAKNQKSKIKNKKPGTQAGFYRRYT